MGIITTIPTNLDFPSRGVLERDDFVLAQETAQDLLAGAYTTALNQYASELNDTEADINLKAEQVANQAVDGGYSQAYIDANFTPKILNAQTDKTTPVDADLIPLSDSVASFGLKKLSWANLKATLKTYFDTLYTIASSETIAGTIEIATTAESQAGTDDSRAITPLKLRNALNASGTAPIYACRAWVNFNGTGTVAIRASGNVSSITDNGTGDYTVNFTTAMPDANYSASGTTNGVGIDRVSVVGEYFGFPRTLSGIRIQAGWSGAGAYIGAPQDASIVTLNVFR